MKSVSFKKPSKPAAAADAWVNVRETPVAAPDEPMKRFTIDVPEELHRRIKRTCADRGLKMADVIREMLEREFSKS